MTDRLAFLLADADAVECRIRLAELRAICALILNWHHPVVARLERGLADPMTIDDALAALGDVPAKHRRRILASFGALHGLVRIGKTQAEPIEDRHCPRCGF
jgi:hypothetical protein